MSRKYTLVPFNAAEGMTLKQAAAVAGKSERTVRDWCAEHGIGRRVAGGTWVVSKVALAMLLDGDLDALASYRDFGVSARRRRPAAAPDASASCFANRLGRARHALPGRHTAG